MKVRTRMDERVQQRGQTKQGLNEGVMGTASVAAGAAAVVAVASAAATAAMVTAEAAALTAKAAAGQWQKQQ